MMSTRGWVEKARSPRQNAKIPNDSPPSCSFACRQVCVLGKGHMRPVRIMARCALRSSLVARTTL